MGINWAVNSTNSADGAIVALAPARYTANAWAPGNHTDVTTSSAPAANSATETLRFNAPSCYTVTLNGTNTVNSGGLLVTSNVGNNALTISGGILRGAAGADLIVQQQNAANSLTISSVIADNLGATGLSKTGPGVLIVSDVNTYTGPTFLSGGTIRVAAIANGSTPSSLGASSSAPENLIFNNGTLQDTGPTAATDRGFTSNGLGATIDVTTSERP